MTSPAAAGRAAWAELAGRPGALVVSRTPGTLRKYGKTLRKLFGRLGWTDVRSATLRSYNQWMTHSPLSPKTRKDLQANLSTFFRWLVRQKLVLENPFQRVSLFQGPDISMKPSFCVFFRRTHDKLKCRSFSDFIDLRESAKNRFERIGSKFGISFYGQGIVFFLRKICRRDRAVCIENSKIILNQRHARPIP